MYRSQWSLLFVGHLQFRAAHLEGQATILVTW